MTPLPMPIRILSPNSNIKTMMRWWKI